MFGLGMPEILVILAVALIVIGPKKLPDLAKSLGRAINEFRRATTELKETLIVETDIKEVKTSFKNPDTELKSAPEKAPDEGKVPEKENPKPKTPPSATSAQESRESDKHA